MPEGSPHHVLVAGGGVAGLEATLALRAHAPEGTRVTLLCPDDDFVYSPLSTGEPFGRTEVTRYPMDRLAAEAAAAWERDALAAVRPESREVRTTGGGELGYDSLIVALGASRHAALEPALTFADERSVPGFRDLLERLRAGRATSVAFLVPRGVVWPFPLYELALMTGELAREEGLEAKLTLVTPASAPLSLFGRPAAEAMASMLAERGVEVVTGNAPRVTAPGRVLLEPDGYVLAADELVALPVLHGPRVAGLPESVDGYVPVDEHARVRGVEGVYAAGDCTDYPIKQGGLAAQEADRAVEHLVAGLEGRAAPEPEPLVLRGVLLTGAERSYLRAGEPSHEDALVSGQALWWPPTKIAGRYLAPFLGLADERERLTREAAEAGVEVEVTVHPGGERLEDVARELG